MKKNLFGLFVFIFLATASQAAIVDTVMIYSYAMKKSSKAVVIIPEKEKPAQGWPVVYLLHGYSGDATNWIRKVPALKEYADQFGLMIVCPDGDYSSWYVDSPVDSSMRYATYIGQEVPNYIDKNYPTRATKQGRAITGLSMGGHGGLYLGIKYKETFGAAGSMSGGVDLLCCTTRFDVPKRIGDSTRYASNWINYSVMGIVETLKPESAPKMIIDCGTEDFFYDINAALHKKMLSSKIPHEYIERPGQHNWDYWANAVQYQLLFFANFFSANE